MRNARLSLLTVAALLATAASGWAAEVAPAAGKAKFANDFSPGVAKILTCAKLLSTGQQFQLREGEGQVSLLGTSMQMQVLQDGVTVVAGLDLNGNGTIERNEAFPIREQVAGVTVPVSGEDGKKVNFPVLLKFTTVIRNPKVRAGKVTAAMGTMYAAGGKKGTINGVEIGLIDDNLDGKFTQDGKDAIVIGKTAAGVPLGTTHKIGNTVYQLKVADDGSTVEFTPVTDAKLNPVDLQWKNSSLACYVIQGDKGTYDVVSSGKTGLPAGEYHLLYGAVVMGNDVIPIYPTKKGESSIVYEISEGCSNTLVMGNPFHASFRGTAAGGTVTVQPSIAITGAAGEIYPVHFSPRIRPNVILLNDNAVISASPMGFG